MSNAASQDHDTQIAVINNSIEVFRSAPQILLDNQNKTAKAISVGNNILAQWTAAWEIAHPEEKIKALATADERSNNYLVNCGNALKQEKELRAAITQMMDNFKKMFTEAENQIDKSKEGTVPAMVQKHRNDFATESHRIAEEKRRKAEKEAARATEAIELKQQAEVRLSNKYNDHLLNVKTRLQTSFNTITLEEFGDREEKLKTYEPALKPEVVNGFDLGLFATHHSREEVTAFITDIISQKLPEFSANYQAELTMLRDELIELLPSKKAELEEQKRLDDEAEQLRIQQEQEKDAKRKEQLRLQQEQAEKERERLAKEQREREEEQARKLSEETEATKKSAEEKAEITAQGEKTMVMFNQEAEVAETMPAAEARQGYEIIVLHPVAYTQIFSLWFEHEGKNMPVDKIGNTKLDQMKAWCEKHAHKTGTKIESKFLQYTETFKAVNRKTAGK